jgi:hypothetical protein
MGENGRVGARRELLEWERKLESGREEGEGGGNRSVGGNMVEGKGWSS